MGKIIDLRERIEEANKGTLKEIRRRRNTREKTKGALEGKRDKELAVVKTRYDEEIATIKTKYDEKISEAEKRHAEEVAFASDIYSRRASKIILEQLRKDYSSMQSRSDLSELFVQDVETESALQKLLDGIENSEQRKGFMKAYLKARGLGEGFEDVKTPIEIVSFIAEQKDKCFLILPIDGNENKKFAKSLETKVHNIISQHEVISRSDNPNLIGQKVHFTADVDEHDTGFVIFALKKMLENQTSLACALTAKLEELQPKGFEEAKLTHRVMIVDYEVLDYFARHKEEKMESPLDLVAEYESADQKYLSVEETAKLLGIRPRTVKRFVTEKRLASDEEGIKLSSVKRYMDGKKKKIPRAKKVKSNGLADGRREALERMAELGGRYLSTKEMAYVLGFKSNEGARRIIRKMIKSGSSKAELVKDEGSIPSSYRIPIKEIREFIHTYEPSSRGWTKSGK